MNFERRYFLQLSLGVGISLVASGYLGAGEGLKLEKVGTEKVYFSYNGRALLSFGGLSDFIFYASEDAYNYKLWAGWAVRHGINHVRPYPPLSYKHIEKFTRENGGSFDNMLFPYEETEPGSRKFDLTKFNEQYWRRFRQQCEELQSRGIIIHLLMWNGWQLRAGDTPGRDRSDIDWAGHFFNPANNVNSFTKNLGGDLENRFAIYHCVADKNIGLVEAQKTWFEKLVELTADLDNIYYDLVHEIKEHHRDWEKVQPWIKEMATTVRKRYAELQPDRDVILGMDTGGFSEAQRDWIFSRDYFDLLIYGKKHTVSNAKQWRTKYKKPYIPQESWDDDGTKYSYRCPNQRVATRKYMWKFMMAKCQQLDLYMKPRLASQAKGAENPPGHDHNYDPRGWNKFEDDALVLRKLWESLTDYPELWFEGAVTAGPGSHRYVLSSKAEAIAYCSSATGKERVRYSSEVLQLEDLALDDGMYSVDIIRPDGRIGAGRTRLVKGGVLSIKLPIFIDDIAVHINSGSR